MATASNAADLIKLLLQQGGDPLIANGDRPITPLHLACYYGSDVEVAKALIDAGGIVTPIGGKPRGSIEVNSPLEMAADQGNYKVIEYVLTTKKGLQAQDKANFPKLLSLLASHVATTSVPDCVSKKGPKCSRCAGNDHPHSPDTNFDKLIEVLFKVGKLSALKRTKMLISLSITGRSQDLRLGQAPRQGPHHYLAPVLCRGNDRGDEKAQAHPIGRRLGLQQPRLHHRQDGHTAAAQVLALWQGLVLFQGVPKVNHLFFFCALLKLLNFFFFLFL